MMGKPKMPDAPKMPDPVRMPSPDDADLIEARRQKMQAEFGKRQGRAATNLSAPSDSQPSFSRTALG